MSLAKSFNYNGRTVDIELLQSVQTPGAEQAVELALVTQLPRKVTGIQKMIQRYTMLLLSALGTVKFAPEQGTTLLSTVAGGGLQTGSASFIFTAASSGVVLAMQDEDRAYDAATKTTTPDDERIVSASLIDFTVDYARATLVLNVQITNAAGTATVFVVPVSA